MSRLPRILALVAVLLLCWVLAGCAAFTSVPVRVAVPVPCTPPEVPSPQLPIDALPEGAGIFEKVRALWATVEALEAYSGQLRASVDACRG